MFPIPGLTTAKLVALAVAIGLGTGFYAGWTVQRWKHEAAVKADQQKTARADADRIVEAQQKAEVLEHKVDVIDLATRNTIDKINDMLDQPPLIVYRDRPAKPAVVPQLDLTPMSSIPAVSVTPATLTCDEAPIREPVVVLPAYVVGLLNRALDPTAPDPDAWSDEEKRTPTEIGLRELSLKLTEVAGQYHDLGLRHDTLVDDVSAFQKKQAAAR